MNTREGSLITMKAFGRNQTIFGSYYNKPHQYMSLVEILKHAIEHYIWNITYTLQRLPIQAAA